jgi:O-antigen ligase
VPSIRAAALDDRPLRWPALNSAGPDALFILYLAFIATLPFARWPIGRLVHLPIQPSDVLLAATYAVWLFCCVRGRVQRAIDGLLTASVTYVSVLAVSIMLTDGAAAHVFKLAAYTPLVLLPSLTARILTTDERWRQAIYVWVSAGLVAIGVGLAGIVAFYLDAAGLGQRFTAGYGSTLPVLPVPRLAAPFSQPNLFANYLVVLLPMLLTFGHVVLRRTVFVGTAAMACTAVTALTLSAAFGGLALAVTITLAGTQMRMANRSRIALWAGAIGTALFFLFASTVSVESSEGGMLSTGSRTLKVWEGPRPLVWRAAAVTVSAHPVLGIGYGTPVAAVADPRAWLPRRRWATDASTIPRNVIVPMEAHNVWLSVLGQAGVVGLTAFVVIIVFLTKPLAHGGSDPRRTVLIAAVVGAFAYHGLVAAVEESRHLWALFGLLAAYANLQRSHGSSQRDKPFEDGRSSAA